MRQKLLSEATEYLAKNRRRRIWAKAVSCLAAVVVFCTTYVLILPALTMEKETICGYEEHTHTEACYQKGTGDVSGGNSTQTVSGGDVSDGDMSGKDVSDGDVGTYCGLHAHKHTAECFGDSDATDVETEDEWKASFTNVTLTGNWAQDVLAIAQSQIGYTENEKNFIYTEEKELKGYTRYGDWYGDSYGDWNAVFAAFCLNYAQVKDFPVEMDYTEWIAALIDANTEDYIIYHQDDSYTPSAGDLVFLDLTQDGIADDIGVAAALLAADNIEPARIQVIEGDCEDKVQTSAYALESTLVLGFADMTTAQEKYIANEALKYADGIKAVSVTATDKGAASVFEYEDENMAITLHVEGEIDFSEVSGGDAFVNGNTALLSQEDLWNEVRCKIQQLDDCGDEYYELAEYALENNGTDELYELKAYEFEFYYKNIELNVETLNVSAEITPNEDMLTVPQMALMSLALDNESSEEGEESAAPEAETGKVISVLGKTGSDITGLDSVLVKSGESPSTLAVSLSSNLLAVTASQTANPSFTVQYYAYIDTAKSSGAKELVIINTDNGGKGTGGKLPQNGVTNLPTKNIYLDEVPNGKYELATEDVLTQVYAQRNYRYVDAPNMSYFNRISENGNYRLSKVWVLKSGKSATSTTKEDWDIYNASTVHFTNREQSANDDNTVLITDNTVIRLIYETTENAYKNAVTFYDYDISDASRSKGTYTYYGVTYNYTLTQTEKKGINSNSNYSGSGTKLAFGNNNSGTGLGTLKWNGYTLNQYNNEGYKGCTFGLTSGLDEKGNIIYSSNVNAPKLFNDGTATGKTVVADYSLTFERNGDTYTLSAVNGTKAIELQYFGSTKYADSMTNSFWPMDSVSHWGQTGHDIKFGDDDKELERLYNEVNRWYCLPKSDDGNDHNSYFGMQYAVEFKLTGDYVGPLEYYFFGDDDMWVFLDGQLVCDIGGVHSSVGQYVNLWDYIKKGDSGTHTLSFFYTERGASGSTCFMRFTLPSVFSVTPEHNTGNLKVEKSVEGVTSTKEFDFEIKLTDANGNQLQDDYAYTRYNSDDTVMMSDLILHGGGTFSLKHGEYIIINYLPNGTKYTITENVPNGFYASVESSGSIEAGNTATGTIVTNTIGVVKYINTASYALPHTGGSGTQWYALAGIVLLLSAAYLLYRRKKYA